MSARQLCPTCGAPVDPADRFCQNCGTPLGAGLVSSSAPFPGAAPAGLSVWPGSDPLLSLEIDYPDSLSRWKIFFKWVFAIPHFLVLSIFGMLISLIVWIAWFVILFTKRYPESLYSLVISYMRWTANVNAYVLFQRDEYPPFGDGPYPAVRLNLPYPTELSRWLIFIKWLLLIPNIVVYMFVGLAELVALLIAWFAILITGNMPRGLFDFITGVSRWGYRINAYSWYLTDRYPPFGLD